MRVPLSLLVAACFVGWRRPDNLGRMAFLAALALLFAALVNSAIRDANIGLALLWIVGIYLRLASDTGFSLSAFSLTRPPARNVN